MRTKFMLCFILSACLLSCASINREVGQLNLNYGLSGNQTIKSDKLIAIVSPEAVKPPVAVSVQTNKLFALAGANPINVVDTYYFNNLYYTNYSNQILTSIGNEIQDIMNL